MHPQLREAANVPARHHALATAERRQRRLGLLGAERMRRLRLIQIIGPRASAAEVRIGQLTHVHPRDCPQQRPRLLPHALRIREVTGIMIRHLQRRFCPGPRHRTEASRLFAQPNLGEKYTHIHHAPSKFLRPRFVRRPA